MVEQLNIAVLPYHLDSFKQAATIAALSFTKEMEERVLLIKSERTRIEEQLSAHNIQVWSSGSNFVLFRPQSRPAKQVWEALLNDGVLVRDCSSWARLDGCLRVTVGTPEENSLFLQAITKALS
jgi:histidinol-phosphate aminotransferase